MKILTNSRGVETHIFAKTIENEALEQIEKLINFEPYQKEKIRIMPDVHVGKGSSIGTTMTITDKVTPNLVGLDIGCGMLTVKLDAKMIDFKKLDGVIKAHIPSGFNVHSQQKSDFDFSNLRAKNHMDVERAKLSIGTLGGGNHFIEVGKCEAGEFYLVIHSGSRKLGTDTCTHYQKRATKNSSKIDKKAVLKKLKAEGREKEISSEMKKLKKSIPDRDLAYLSGEDFSDYMNDMAIVQKFASINRETMADIILEKAGLKEIERFETIHNYIDFDRMILRKGAVSAEKGEILLIPINMRDGSLLCVGKGNENWNYSAPHGAGRVMSRNQARRELNMDDFKNSMKNVYSTSVGTRTLDEAPGAYKPIEEIQSTIGDTAEVIAVIKPLYNFKAH